MVDLRDDCCRGSTNTARQIFFRTPLRVPLGALVGKMFIAYVFGASDLVDVRSSSSGWWKRELGLVLVGLGISGAPTLDPAKKGVQRSLLT